MENVAFCEPESVTRPGRARVCSTGPSGRERQRRHIELAIVAVCDGAVWSAWLLVSSSCELVGASKLVEIIECKQVKLGNPSVLGAALLYFNHP